LKRTRVRFRQIKNYGWKWETPGDESQGYHATYLKTDDYDIRLQPFYLLYGGVVHTGSLNGAGINGWYWSSTAGALECAYQLVLDASIIVPSFYNAYLYGFSIRCLAR